MDTSITTTPTDYCCVNCSTIGNVGEIHIYSSSNEFERSITILNALCDIFASPNLLQAQAAKIDITMCIKCAENLSYIYQSYYNLLQLSTASSYLSKLMIQFENWHVMRNTDAANTDYQIPLFSLEADEDSYDDQVNITQTGSNEPENKEHVTVTDTVKLKPGILKKRNKFKLSPSKKIMKSNHGIQKTNDTIQTEGSNGIEPRKKGRYVCRNINKRRYFKCNQCSAQFVPVFELHEHILLVHESKRKSKCNKCSFTYLPEITKIETHVCIDDAARKIIKKSRPYMCDVCGMRFGGQKLLTFHKEKVHSQEDIRYKCYICGKPSVDRHKLYNHMEIHTESKSYLCSECGKSFAQKRGLDRHLEIHFIPRDERLEQKHSKEKGIYPCDICNKTFIYKRNLQEHFKMHNPQLNKYRCIICEKPHWTRARLNKHVLTHNPKPYEEVKVKRTRQRPFGDYILKPYNPQTSQEEVKFKEITIQKQGLKMTKPQNNFDEITVSSFSSEEFKLDRKSLDDEGFIHTSSLVCLICHKSLQNEKLLSIHLRTHVVDDELDDELEERVVVEFRCDECPNVFTSLKDLNVHSASAHCMDVSLVKCEFCNTQCLPLDYKNHLRLEHPEKVPDTKYEKCLPEKASGPNSKKSFSETLLSKESGSTVRTSCKLRNQSTRRMTFGDSKDVPPNTPTPNKFEQEQGKRLQICLDRI